MRKVSLLAFRTPNLNCGLLSVKKRSIIFYKKNVEGRRINDFKQSLLSEAVYHLKNYGDQGGSYYTLRDLHNSSDDTKTIFNNCCMIYSK